MWLLSTETAKFESFDDPDDEMLLKDGGYTILSHVWLSPCKGKEQSFQDIQALQTPRTPTSLHETPRSRASPKIRDCCILAESHGYHWVWIDTCCIDKTSSAELSEAINSMYQWYSKAAVCYAYLEDVENGDIVPGSPFYRSRWWTRGWTLQELIAPKSLLFIARDWTILGTRTALVEHVQNITGIDKDILLCRRSLGSVSIARRMSWASRRKTTRVEDEAYSLLGIFGVSMPTIYGEGQTAFYRLQEEIMKTSPDQTIFAWGRHRDFQRISRANFGDPGSHELPEFGRYPHCCLLAPSPSDFGDILYNDGYRPEPIPVTTAIQMVSGYLRSSNFNTREIALPNNDNGLARESSAQFTVTSHGMRSTLPLIWFRHNAACIAVLGCQDALTGAVMGLLLLPLPSQESSSYHGDHRVYATPGHLSNALEPADYECRLVMFRTQVGVHAGSFLGYYQTAASVEPLNVSYGTITWDIIHIMHRPPPSQQADTQLLVDHFAIGAGLHYVAVQFSRWSMAELEKWGFRHKAGTRMEYRHRYYQVDEFVSDVAAGEEFIVIVAQCNCSSNFGPGSSSLATLAVAFSSSNFSSNFYDTPQEHLEGIMALEDCRLGHIDEGQGWTRMFGDEDRAVEITTGGIRTRSQSEMRTLNEDNPLYLLTVDIKLSGSIYTSQRERARLNLDQVHRTFRSMRLTG